MKNSIDILEMEWIKTNMPAGSVIGVNRNQITQKDYKASKFFYEMHGFSIKTVETIIDDVWGVARPLMN